MHMCLSLYWCLYVQNRFKMHPELATKLPTLVLGARTIPAGAGGGGQGTRDMHRETLEGSSVL